MLSNAGIFSSSTQTVLELDLAQLDRLFNINVRGMAACVKHAARAMVELNVRGSIVCTASTAASSAGEMNTDYFITKHAVLGWWDRQANSLGCMGLGWTVCRRLLWQPHYSVGTSGRRWRKWADLWTLHSVERGGAENEACCWCRAVSCVPGFWAYYRAWLGGGCWLSSSLLDTRCSIIWSSELRPATWCLIGDNSNKASLSMLCTLEIDYVLRLSYK